MNDSINIGNFINACKGNILINRNTFKSKSVGNEYV